MAPRAESVVRPLAERIPAVPAKTEDAVRLNGAVQMVAGLLLALGRFPRLSALALAGTLVPTTAAGHRFWEAEEEADRAQQRIHFLKNLSMLGGLLITAADTAGNPSLAWRTRHAAKTARRESSLVARTAKASGKAWPESRAPVRAPSGQLIRRGAGLRSPFGLTSWNPGRADNQRGIHRPIVGHDRSASMTSMTTTSSDRSHPAQPVR